LKAITRTSVIIPSLFFLAYLTLGITIYPDYGMSWDEALQREHGNVSARYVDHWYDYSEHKYSWQDLYEYPHRHYGVWYSTPMAWLEKYLELDNFRQYYHLRHLSVFLLFWLAGIFFYRILLKRFQHWSWALLGVSFLILSPRIFAHSFYNPKDLPLLALYVFSTCTLFKFWLKPSLGTGLLHGLACGMLISMRVVGLIMPMMTVFLIAADMLFNKILEPRWYKRYLLGMLIYLPSLAFFTVAFWPYLWECPWQNLMEAFGAMSQYGWEGKVLFAGRFMYGDEVPWYYIPHWIGISTPLPYLFLLGVGIISLFPPLWTNIRRRRGKCLWAKDEERKDWAMLGLILAPVLAVIVQESIVYDGWRHLFFIYPCLVYLAVLGAYHIWQQRLHWVDYRQKSVGNIMVFVLVLSVVPVAWFMIKYHPFQNVYFNALKRGNQFGQYDLDYWGNSYKQGMEALLELDQSDTIKLAYQSHPATLNYRFLRPDQQYRIELVEDWQQADYYISNYRTWAEGIKQARQRQGPYAGKLVHSIEVAGKPILGIYKVE